MPNYLCTDHPSLAVTGLILVKLIIFDSTKAEQRELPFCFVSLTVYLQLGWDLSLESRDTIYPIHHWFSKTGQTRLMENSSSVDFSSLATHGISCNFFRYRYTEDV